MLIPRLSSFRGALAHQNAPPDRRTTRAPRGAASPESIFQRPVFMDSGPRPLGDPGMAFLRCRTNRLSRDTGGWGRPALRNVRSAILIWGQRAAGTRLVHAQSRLSPKGAT